MDQTNSNKKNNGNDSQEEDLDKIEKPSYTYWKRESDKPFSNEFKPQKSDSNIDETSKSTVNKYGSSWNKAGTWEEKHFTKTQIEEFFNQSLQNRSFKINDCCTIEKINSYSGDVNKI
jgi:hypothetical protein